MLFAITMKLLLLIVVVVGAALGFAAATNSVSSPFNNVKFVLTKTPRLTELCLNCLCDDYRGALCDVSELCGNNATKWHDCDLLGLTRYQWSVGGNHTLHGESQSTLDAYVNCKRDPECAARSVQGFLASYEADCTKNSVGISTCWDYASIHFYGLTGQCDKKEMHRLRRSRFERCLQTKVVQAAAPSVTSKSQQLKRARKPIVKQNA